jgi:hypothetical protein
MKLELMPVFWQRHRTVQRQCLGQTERGGNGGLGDGADGLAQPARRAFIGGASLTPVSQI